MRSRAGTIVVLAGVWLRAEPALAQTDPVPEVDVLDEYGNPTGVPQIPDPENPKRFPRARTRTPRDGDPVPRTTTRGRPRPTADAVLADPPPSGPGTRLPRDTVPRPFVERAPAPRSARRPAAASTSTTSPRVASAPAAEAEPAAAAPAPPPAPSQALTSGRPPPRARASASRTPTSDSAAAREAAQPKPRPGGSEELIRRSQGSIDFYELVDEMLDEIAYQVGKQDLQVLSPMAVRAVRLSPNLRPEFARTLEARLTARIAKATGVRMNVCVECSALRSRVEDGQWLVALGAVRQADLKQMAETLGVHSFMDVGFTFNPESNVVWMEVTAFRADNGAVVWTDAYRSDGTTAALLRTGRRIPSRAERVEELDGKIRMRPSYGYAVSLGMMQLGYAGPTGDLNGAVTTLRFHERFGEQQEQLFGFSAGLFLNGFDAQQALRSILFGAYYSRNLSQPNLNRPEWWAYGEFGGLFSGNEGNSLYGEAGLDVHLKWRLSALGGVMYVRPTKFLDHDLGGLGFRLRIAMNW